VASVLSAALGDLCARKRLAPSLAATAADVKQLVRARLAGAPLPENSLLTHGWRAAHILPELIDLLDGKRALRIANVAAEAPFAYE
jgi:ribonuclease D